MSRPPRGAFRVYSEEDYFAQPVEQSERAGGPAPPGSRANRLAGAALLAGMLGAVGALVVLNLRQRDGHPGHTRVLRALAATQSASPREGASRPAAGIPKARFARAGSAVRRIPLTALGHTGRRPGMRVPRASRRSVADVPQAHRRPAPKAPSAIPAAAVARTAVSAPQRSGGEFGFEH